jgi:hypothetical protein
MQEYCTNTQEASFFCIFRPYCAVTGRLWRPVFDGMDSLTPARRSVRRYVALEARLLPCRACLDKAGALFLTRRRQSLRRAEVFLFLMSTFLSLCI